MDVYWLEQTAADLPSQENWLSSAENLLLNRMRFPRRRADWKLGRWTAKRAVTAYLHIPGGNADLAGVEITPAPSGAPEVWIANQLAPLTISISHRSGNAVCAVAPFAAALGFDLELIEPRSQSFIADYFTEEERAAIARALPRDRPLLVTLLWSAKESALKTLGMGLRLDTRSAVVNLADEPKLPQDHMDLGWDASWRPLQVCVANGRRFDGWWQSDNDFVRTVTAEPSPSLPIQIPRTIRQSQALA